MTAIIKNNFRVQNAKDFLENLVSHPREGRQGITYTYPPPKANIQSSASFSFTYVPRSDIADQSSDKMKFEDYLKGLKTALGSHVIDRNHYLFIGKPLPWNEPSTPGAVPELSPAPPRDTYSEEYRVWDEMLSLKKISDLTGSLVIPRVDWDASGLTIYDKFDDNPPKQPVDKTDLYGRRKFYVMNDEFQIFVCLENGNNGLSKIRPTKKPTVTELIDYRAQDGYVWKYLTTVTPTDAKKFLTDSWIPVKTLGDIPDNLTDQWDIEVDARSNYGNILSFDVVSGGTNYASAPTVTVLTNGIPNNGTEVTATAQISGGRVVGVNIISNVKGATWAKVELQGGGGSGAQVRAILSPYRGFGSDIEKDLGAFYVMLNAYVKYEEGAGDFPANNDFRQIGIIRNVLERSATGNPILASSDTLIATKKVRVTDVSAGANSRMFEPDEFLIGPGPTYTKYGRVLEYKQDSNSAAGIITGTITYLQNPETEYNSLSPNLQGISGSLTGAKCNVQNIPDAIISEEVVKYHGEILYLENRRPVLRSPEQVEDIKAIVEF